MAKYLDFLYREDTYGERDRTEVPISFTDFGYRIDPSGNTVPDFAVKVGPISWRASDGRPESYPTGSRVAIIKSTHFYPPNPDRLISEKRYDQDTDTTEFLYLDDTPMLIPDEDSILEPGTIFHFRCGKEPLGWVSPGKVLYISVYISEPFWDQGGNQTVWLPWDLRGSRYFVVPDNHGGVSSAMNALPRAVMTGGLVYGEHIENPQTSLMASIGYMTDVLMTDGELISAPIEDIHPNMVLPLLRGLGMSPQEEVFFTDRTVNHRLKNILAHYRAIATSKGTELGINRYVTAATGLSSQVVGPLNHLLDRSDTCPDNNIGEPSKDNPLYSVTTSAARWERVPSKGWEDEYTGSETVREGPVGPYLTNGSRDPWFNTKNPEPAVAWVHKIWCSGETTFGSKDGIWYAPIAKPGQMFEFRYRYWADTGGGTASAVLKFLDVNGAVLEARSFPDQPILGGDWESYTSELAIAPDETRFVAWQVVLDSSSAISIGAIQLSEGGGARYYRDPRSYAVLAGSLSYPTSKTWASMDSAHITMEDEYAKMDETGRVSDSFEKVLLGKLRAVLKRYVPMGTSMELLTSDDVEFYRYWAKDYG